MLFDFPSALNTMQPHLLVQKLLKMKQPWSVISRIFDYLINRLQYVGANGVLSFVICKKNKQPDAPQGTVLAPFLLS